MALACTTTALAALAAVSAPAAQRAACPAGHCCLTAEPVEKNLGNGFRSWVYTEPWRDAYFKDGLWPMHDRAYDEYTAWLNVTIPRDFGGLDPFNQRQCLEHQRAIFEHVGYSTYNWDIILNGTVGGLFQMNCIEALMWGQQNKYHPQRVSATEFGAYILRSRKGSNDDSMKVYLQTGPTLGVPGMSWVNPLIHADLGNGYDLVTFLHLHPFDASNIKYQDCAGTCIPSDPDLAAFASDLAMFKAQEAWITNGADSFRFPMSQLGLFHKDGSQSKPEIFRGEAPAPHEIY